MPEGVGGTDRSLVGLREPVADALSTTQLRKRLAKLRSTDEVEVDERQLFIPARLSAFPFVVIDGLIVSTTLPPSPLRASRPDAAWLAIAWTTLFPGDAQE